MLRKKSPQQKEIDAHKFASMWVQSYASTNATIYNTEWKIELQPDYPDLGLCQLWCEEEDNKDELQEVAEELEEEQLAIPDVPMDVETGIYPDSPDYESDSWYSVINDVPQPYRKEEKKIKADHEKVE